ncbi:phosphatase PAP2 family protein [uncultured Duncaniella sp.]|uniref:phosphatase PAP2 family protein n=1 Tax=uncultured Duncaniella sp. TaxID=2768039 RepID=UPI0025D2D258|nr:phosphatase PAP2 family protein [uncultured Duncaniella sp.]
MKRISQILSWIFSPLLVPTYAMVLASFLSVLVALPSRVLWTTVAITFVLTCVIPVAGITGLYKSGVVKDFGLNARNERTIPYILVALCYAGCGYFLWRAGAPQWLTFFFAGGAAAVIVNIIVNLRWKISAHSAAMGGLVAMMFRLAASHQAVCDLNVWLSLTVLAAGLVMTARVYLQCHTLMQVFAGALNGFLCVWLCTMIHIAH